jgi:hypothetical protein
MKHIVVVDSYDGIMEVVSDEDAERDGARGLGLPLGDIAARLGCRITTLTWDSWRRYEDIEGAFPRWMPTPTTRPIGPLHPRPPAADDPSRRVRQIPLPARDPDFRQPFAVAGVSPRSHGLLANSDPLFLLGYCLNVELQELHREDPFDAIVLSMWGGLGYVAQVARATGVPEAVDVPFAVVVTDTSRRRQEANQEGLWTRPAITRRQMEDVSLALADLVLTFGPRGDAIATAGRLPEAAPPVRVPRRVPLTVIEALSEAQRSPASRSQRLQAFLYEPQDGASGVLGVLDAVTLLHRRRTRLPSPVVSAGPEMTFAPMKPRGFVDYWSSRGSVRTLVTNRQWAWARDYVRTDDVLPVRLYPSLFEHLPSVWTELARGSAVLMSPAAVEGIAPGGAIPADALIDGEPTPERLATRLQQVLFSKVSEVDDVRRRLCATIVDAHRGAEWGRLLDDAVKALDRLVGGRAAPPDLGRAALLFLDRQRPLRAIAEATPPPPATPVTTRPGTLTVVVTCYEMGALLAPTIESVWASTHRPDELLMIDDGSEGTATRDTIASLQSAATARALPLRVVRQDNRGLATARNAGLAAVTTEFVSFLDGDDLIEPIFYDLATRLLARHPALGGIAGWALCFGDGVPDGFWNAPQPELPLLLVENPVFVPCVMRTDTLRRLGGYDARQRYNYEDWELTVRLVAAGHPIITIPLYLQRYRVRPDSLLRTMSDVQNQAMRERMLETHRDTVARFAVETAMMIEHQLAKRLYAEAGRSAPATPAPTSPLIRALGRTGRVLRRTAGFPTRGHRQ